MNNIYESNYIYLEGYKDCIACMEKALKYGASLEITLRAAKKAYEKTKNEFLITVKSK